MVSNSLIILLLAAIMGSADWQAVYRNPNPLCNGIQRPDPIPPAGSDHSPQRRGDAEKSTMGFLLEK
jgi:hypothetical protein